MEDTVIRLAPIRYANRARQWIYTSDTPHDPNVAYDDLPTSLTLITWNINYDRPNSGSRAHAALSYLQEDVFAAYYERAPPPCVIMLQEVAHTSFCTILEHPWVRRHFVVLPGSPEYWPRGTSYGAVTLLSRGVRVAQAVSLQYRATRMGRTALLVDVLVPGGRVLRVGNTHLESLAQGADQRWAQLRAVAVWLHDAQVAGGIVCGDMNAIAQADAEMVRRFGMRDAWDHRAEGELDGATWGYQPMGRFPPGRLDKILYVRRREYRIRGTQKIGAGLKLPSGQFVSDHYGLICQVVIAS